MYFSVHKSNDSSFKVINSNFSESNDHLQLNQNPKSSPIFFSLPKTPFIS